MGDGGYDSGAAGRHVVRKTPLRLRARPGEDGHAFGCEQSKETVGDHSHAALEPDGEVLAADGVRD